MSWVRTSTWSVVRSPSWTRTPSRLQSSRYAHGLRYAEKVKNKNHTHLFSYSPPCTFDPWFSLRNNLLDCSFISFPQAYKESVLEPMLQGTDKTPALISDYKEYHTDSTVKFVVRMTEEKLAQAEAAGLHKVFKLQSSLTCNSMVRQRTHLLLYCHLGLSSFKVRNVSVLSVVLRGFCPCRCCLITWAA